MREKVYINKICWFIDIVFPQDWTNDRPKLICPICNEGFKTADKMYMVISDKLFPNCFIHWSCSAHSFEDTGKNIMQSYHEYNKCTNQYNKCIKKYKAWW